MKQCQCKNPHCRRFLSQLELQTGNGYCYACIAFVWIKEKYRESRVII